MLTDISVGKRCNAGDMEQKTWIQWDSFALKPLRSCLNGLQRYSREEGVGGDCNMNMTENLFDFASFKTGQTKIDSSQNLFPLHKTEKKLR